MFPKIKREPEAERPRRAQSVPASAERRYAKPPAAALSPPAACREFPKSRPSGRRYADFSDALHRFPQDPGAAPVEPGGTFCPGRRFAGGIAGKH